MRLPRSAWLSGGSQVFARKNYGRLSDAISAPLSLVLSASWRRMQGKTWLTGSSKTRGGHKCKQFLALTQIKRVRQNFATPTSRKRSSETQRTRLSVREAGPHPDDRACHAVRALAVAQRVWRLRATSGLQQRPTTVIDRSVGLPRAVVQPRQRAAICTSVATGEAPACLAHSWCKDNAERIDNPRQRVQRFAQVCNW